MAEKNSLLEVYKQTKGQLVGHGPRNIQILQDAFLNVDSGLESDMYGTGKVIENFQAKMAQYLGKEDAVFFPSGTMAQQIALRVWCDDRELQSVAYHPLSHLEIHEEDGLKKLHHIKTILLADKNRVIELDDVKSLQEDIACLLLELPQREIGGQLPTFETLKAISEYCRERGIKLHLDGARLYEILPYYKKTAIEVCELFDSVYVSFYKGIGGIAGAILAGEHSFVKNSKIWKRRYGGDLISLYPYIISANYYFDDRVNKMERYYEDAKELASYYNKCYGITTVPDIPMSNMFHVYLNFPKEKVEKVLINIYEATNIGLTGRINELDEQSCYFEVSIGDQYSTINKTEIDTVFSLLNKQLKEII
ncbi:threonine aldolase family protein [Bacillus salitolerans]|uniref:Threonine aldolase family protein n=1 Tax=Bacillus salitolerans TaxID=1437434 RepID=A0ABW4LQ56_9BACI